MEHCRILNKIRNIPFVFDKFLRNGDLLFRAHGIFVLIDNENNLDKPYEVYYEEDIIRLDKRVLKELNDGELSVIIFRAKIEKELYLILSKKDEISDEADYLLTQRYPEELLNTIDEKLNKIYNSMN